MPLMRTLLRRQVLQGDLVADPESVFEKETTPEEFAALVRQQGASGARAIQTVVDAPSPAVRMWDRITQDWTQPYPQNAPGSNPRGRVAMNGIQAKLATVVSRCSACQNNALYEKGTRLHIEETVNRGKAHAQPGVQMEGHLVNDEMRHFCTGCTYAARPSRALGHIAKCIEEGRRHEGATPITMRRYSLQPELPALVVATGHADAEASPQERSDRQGRRRRRRSRNRCGNGTS